MSDHRTAKARFTRRRMLTTTAAVGVGAAAVSVTGLSLAHTRGKPGGAARGEALVVHLRDAKSGALEIFVGTERISVRDANLASQLLKAAKRA